jgi:hypothetical protein
LLTALLALREAQREGAQVGADLKNADEWYYRGDSAQLTLSTLAQELGLSSESWEEFQ